MHLGIQVTDVSIKRREWVRCSCILSMEVSGHLDAAAALLSWQKTTEHETGLLSSGVMGICHMKHRMDSCHYRGKIPNVA